MNLKNINYETEASQKRYTWGVWFHLYEMLETNKSERHTADHWFPRAGGGDGWRGCWLRGGGFLFGVMECLALVITVAQSYEYTNAI